MRVTKSEDKPAADKSNEHSSMRRILGNFVYLLRGRGVAGLMLFGATALAARGLGPAEFGLLILIQTYSQLVRSLLNFKQFQGIVRYGVPIHDNGDMTSLRRLVLVNLRIDRDSTIVAFIVALALAPFVGPLIGMDEQHAMLLALYTLVIPLTGKNTATGVLRLFDRFDVIGTQMTIGPTIRFCGVVFAWWFDAPLLAYVLIMMFASIVKNLYLMWCGWREYMKQIGHPSEGEDNSKAHMSEFPGLRNFLWVTYWQSNVDLVPRKLSTMMVGYLLGATDVGMLRLARQVSSMMSKPATLIRTVVFPDLTRSWHQGHDDFGMIAFRISMIAGGSGLLFVLLGYFFGTDLLAILFGQEYVGAATVLTLLLLAASFNLAASSLRSAAYAIGHAGKVLRIHVVSSVLYLVLFFVLAMQFGLWGVGIATCIAYAIPPIAMALLIKKSIRHRSSSV